MPTDKLPCFSIQEEDIARSAQAMMTLPEPDESGRTEVAACHHLGDDNPDMYRMWQLKGSLATVTFFDEGNGWACIDDLKTESPEDRQEFTQALWDRILSKASSSQQIKNIMARSLRNCRKTDNCHCAERLAAPETA